MLHVVQRGVIRVHRAHNGVAADGATKHAVVLAEVFTFCLSGLVLWG